MKRNSGLLVLLRWSLVMIILGVISNAQELSTRHMTMPRSQSQKQRSLQDGVDNNNGASSPSLSLESLNAKCQAWEETYQYGFEAFQSSCTCLLTDQFVMGGWQATCRDSFPYCMGDVCSIMTSQNFFDKDDRIVAFWTCHEFPKDEQEEDEETTTFCFQQQQGQEAFGSCIFRINNAPCGVCDLCGGGFKVDCSNLGYGANINTCTQTGLEGPFAIYQNGTPTVGRSGDDVVDMDLNPTAGPTAAPVVDLPPPGVFVSLDGCAMPWFLQGYETQSVRCTCSSSTILAGAVWEVICHDLCEHCLDDGGGGESSLCSFVSRFSYQDATDSSGTEVASYTCHHISVGGGALREEKLCLWQQTSTCKFVIDNELCTSCRVCDDMGGIVVDCSNLGYNNVVDTCQKIGLEGPFEIYRNGVVADPSVITPGECLEETPAPTSPPTPSLTGRKIES